ncbi:hypothetical protein AB1339_27760 [Streptomyces cyaneofuscatus]|uniref:hypothetical protein n=1 Tax=Streptomyces cyaneofuscatus TaxID=66883 RepID=UPI00345CA7E0
MIPGWPYSFIAALEVGRTSRTALLDAVRLEPGADVAAVTAVQEALNVIASVQDEENVQVTGFPLPGRYESLDDLAAFFPRP